MTELQLQSRCFQWAWNTYPELRRLLFAVPNGGTRHAREAMNLKASGTVPGIPDMICLYNGSPVGIEFKTDAGVVSKEQREVHQIWSSAGIPVHIIRNEEAFQLLIKSIIQ